MTTTNRPTEIHVKAVTSVEREALPLISSIVYGEIYAPEMINMRNLGVTSPGIFCGFNPVIKSGLTLILQRDQSEGFGAALCQIGLQQFHIVQQHDMEITLTTGFKWNVVLEAFYQKDTLTRQVHHAAEHDAASVRAVLDNELTDEMQVICEVDLTSGTLVMEPDMITTDKRVDQTFTISQHINENDPHPQYASKTDLNALVNDEIAELISQNYNGFSTTNPISENAVRIGLATKAASSHAHTGDEIVQASVMQFGVVQLTNSYTSVSTELVPTANALSSGLSNKADAQHSHNADTLPTASTTQSGCTRLSNSYMSDATDSAATPSALKTGLELRAEKEHTHEADELPEASVTSSGIVLLSNQYSATSETTVPTSNALALGLKLKADKAVLLESNANTTMTRGGQLTTLLRTERDASVITIDVSTFQTADEIRVINIHPSAGAMTITNNAGKIIAEDGTESANYVLNGQGRVLFIKTVEENAIQVIESHLY